MQNNPNQDRYNELTAKQIEQYKETELMHDLPLIFHYWSKKYISEKVAAVTGYSDIVDFYAGYFSKSIQKSDSNFLVSVGAGDCSIEVEITKRLISEGRTNFSFICLELSPILIDKARKKIDKAELSNVITVSQTDINNWKPGYKFAGVMAHHSLHHFLNLEGLFELIKNNLAENGRFLTCDIIGRNGHMRWPEALGLIRRIWEKIPRRYKYNHHFMKIDDYFENWDCSNEGFEGIRAEDILPLLIKTFSFEAFFSYGNLIDPFIDRGFGPNFNPSNSNDTAFIDFLQETNEQLISEGILKPTAIIAVMTNEKKEPIVYKDWTPKFAVRNPQSEAPFYDIDPLLKNIPFVIAGEDNPLTANEVKDYTLNTKLQFGNRYKSEAFKYLKYGWGSPEDNFIWSLGDSAAIMFPLGNSVATNLSLGIEFIPYQSALHKYTSIDIAINNKHIKSVSFDNKSKPGSSVLNIDIPPGIVVGKNLIEVSLFFPERRRPQYEGGSDVRSLGIALISAGIFMKQT